MAVETRTYAVVVPAGTAEATPQLSDLAMPARIVRGIRVRVPPGPGGELGWALAAAGQAIIPWGGGTWIVADDEVITWTPEQTIESGAWQLLAWNTGTYDHTVYVTFELDPPGQPAGGAELASLPLVGMTG